MKKILCLGVILLCLLFSSCAGLNDWSVSLPNDFVICHINSQDIKVVYTGDEPNVQCIPSFIKEFSFNERYVCTRNVEKISENNVLNETYYVLDTEEKALYGPYENLSELQETVNELNFEVPTYWHRTSPDPNLNIKVQ